jgi:hypothetical protein
MTNWSYRSLYIQRFVQLLGKVVLQEYNKKAPKLRLQPALKEKQTGR